MCPFPVLSLASLESLPGRGSSRCNQRVFSIIPVFTVIPLTPYIPDKISCPRRFPSRLYEGDLSIFRFRDKVIVDANDAKIGGNVRFR